MYDLPNTFWPKSGLYTLSKHPTTATEYNVVLHGRINGLSDGKSPSEGQTVDVYADTLSVVVSVELSIRPFLGLVGHQRTVRRTGQRTDRRTVPREL
jgi:hypothetical protein